MGADRDAVAAQHLNAVGQPAAAFQLDHVGAGLHQLGAVGQSLFQGGVGHERQIGHDQCALVAALDRSCVVRHVVDADRQGAVVTLQDHTQGVADQHHLDTGFAFNMGEGRVVGCQANDLFAALLELVQCGQSNVRHGCFQCVAFAVRNCMAAAPLSPDSRAGSLLREYSLGKAAVRQSRGRALPESASYVSVMGCQV